jgi:hypothetical protein
MHRIRLNPSFLVTAVAALLLTATAAFAQEDAAAKIKLASAVTVYGNVGGESHDGYVVHAVKGQTLTVTLGWRNINDDRAEFTVSQSDDFFNSSPVGFGETSRNGRRWVGVAPATGDYYIYVVAHPEARYSLRATVK